MRQVTLVLLVSVLCISIFLAPVTATAAEGIASGLLLEAGFGCKMQDGKLVCGNKKGSSKKDDDEADDDDEPKKSKDKVIPKTCGKKVRCDPGFVVLEKPNQYGACCEAREGLPPPKTAKPEKCQFPGEVGTPPNCTCPPGTEFLGYKGCVTPYCCTSYGADWHGGGSIKACGEHGEAQKKVTGHLFNGHPPARFECYPKK